mgnify:FL=1
MWGYLRETTEAAEKAGTDKATGLCRTGLNEYLKVIFPNTSDWVHDRVVPDLIDQNGKKVKTIPDYRSESLKLIVEFDGIQHYTNPDNIDKDIKKTKVYEQAGYKVVRLPYFIQLTNKVVKQLFDVDVKEQLFDESYPSLCSDSQCSPAYLCYKGIKRMAEEFKKFPEQYEININTLKTQDPDNWTEWKTLEELYKK